MTSNDLKRFSLLAEFTKDDRDALAGMLEPRKLVEGRTLFREQGEADGLVLIVSGQVRLEGTRTGPIGVVGPGDNLGALSLVVVGPREVTAVAESACTLLLLPRSSFRRLADDHPRTAFRLVEAIARELADLVRGELDAFAAAARGR